MEEVPAHVHPRPIVPEVLSREHEHRSGLIWSGDHETCYTNLQCRCFGRNLFQCYSTAPCRLVKIIDRTGIRPTLLLLLAQYGAHHLTIFIWLPYLDRALVLSDLWRAEVSLICYEIVEYHYPGRWRLRVRDAPAVVAEALSYLSDEYIRWYRGIIRVYIGNPVNRDTRSHKYQPAGLNRQMTEMDDMASVVIQEPPSSPLQMALFAKKVQTIIRRCMVSIGGTLGCTPLQHNIQQTFHVRPSHRRSREQVPDRGARRVKRGARRHPRCGAGGGRPLVPPAPERHEHVDPGHVEVERGEGSRSGQPTVDPFDSPNSYQLVEGQ
ncbi:hypothetical protein M9H77_20749 [Catharanthus roseus]|uniref:Uncharacterized protein n=1 Tax=Catharanthus roseus TaxID=4058 RepID=A0ACC0APL4_CATRO|nr:hypothetical protein M9H77_20749 [Catharanthus roseus]